MRRGCCRITPVAFALESGALSLAHMPIWVVRIAR
jgi:hypothetical protein